MSSSRTLLRSNLVTRQLLSASRTQSGRCLRCFHDTRRARAETNATTSNDNADASPHQLRTAAARNELAALAQSEPRRIDATSTPQNNDERSATAESEPRRTDTTSTPPNNDQLSAPAQSEPGRIDSTYTPQTYDFTEIPYTPQDNDNTQNIRSPRNEQRSSPTNARSIVKGRRPRKRPVERSIATLRIEGLGTATIASKGFGIINDRRALVKPTGFEMRRSRKSTRHAEAMRAVDAKLLSGKHDGEDLLFGKEKYKQGTLNQVARAMLLNPTYLASDSTRFVDKVRSLLPAATRPRPSNAVPPQS